MKYLFVLLMVIIFTTSAVSAQQQFFLKNKKSGRLKRLKQQTNFEFEFKTSDRSRRAGYFGRLIEMTDSTLVIREYVKPSLRQSIKPATLTITTSDITSIKNYLIDNDDFNTLGGMLVIGGILGAAATPIVWIADGKESGQDGAAFTAGLFAAGGLLLLPQFIGKRRHMAKWEFVRGN